MTGPTLAIGIFDPILELIPTGTVQTTVVLVLLVGVLYFRKALGLGSVLADWAGRVMFSAIVLVILLVTGIVPRINVDAARSLLSRGLDLASRLVGVIG